MGAIRVINEIELLECAMYYLDLCRPNPDKTQDYAERMGMEYREETEDWLDVEGVLARVRKNMLIDPWKTGDFNTLTGTPAWPKLKRLL